jgi:hypothetical protein
MTTLSVQTSPGSSQSMFTLDAPLGDGKHFAITMPLPRNPARTLQETETELLREAHRLLGEILASRPA